MEEKDPPIVPMDFCGGTTVVDIGDIRVQRGLSRRPFSACPHRGLTYDRKERRIWCKDCERDIFDAYDYFRMITGAQRDAALDEMGVEKKDRPKKKAEAVAACTSKALAIGWLPRELRHPSTMVEGDAT